MQLVVLWTRVRLVGSWSRSKLGQQLSCWVLFRSALQNNREITLLTSLNGLFRKGRFLLFLVFSSDSGKNLLD